MKIKSITFENFKIYKGFNQVVFQDGAETNVSLIGGKNGYGKTTFLTGLIWLFYGKMMSKVEDKYRNDIKKIGGYDKYLKSLLNNKVLNNPGIKEFSVSVELMDVMIPSIACETVKIQRSYNFHKEEESLNILIDNKLSELTENLGFEVFINDFILPREIAKFFFFDAEKIVSLAEAKSKSELRALSKAYSEVLGIKKYEDLKDTLKALLSKLRREGAEEYEKKELRNLQSIVDNFTSVLESLESEKLSLEDEIRVSRSESDRLQEKLIREGSSISLEDLKILKVEKKELEQKNKRNKNELKRYFDVLPFVISMNKTNELYQQIVKEKEYKVSNDFAKRRKKELHDFSEELTSEIKILEGDKDTKDTILETISILLNKNYKQSEYNLNVLLNFSDKKSQEFETFYHYLKSSFQIQFESIIKNENDTKVLLNRVRYKIKQAEARKNNALNKKLAEQKEIADERIKDYTDKIEEIIAEIAKIKVQRNSANKKLSEYEKNFKISEQAREKYKVTEELLYKLNFMISRIKEEKKFTLQKSIKIELDRLFHKDSFIKDVKVNIYEDYMDIDLIDYDNKTIDKNSLSKGEQQLYATSILKALVGESGIDFPIFIDSPLQKLDPQHAKNVITEFYPNVSDQVIIFPLLEKELTEEEFNMLRPHLENTFLIENTNSDGSSIKKYPMDEVFVKFKEQLNVYAD
ncbi:MAG: DNA sulfur modification protein DndD [Weeksellaceae bacterium]